MTNLGAENFRIASFDVNYPEAGFTTLVPEHPDSVLTEANIYGTDKLVLVYQQNARHEIHIHDLNTGKQLRQLFKDDAGQVTTVSGGQTDNEMFIYYSDFMSPGTIYRQVIVSY